MKYKVGDRVKVKSEFDFYEKYQGKQFVIEERDSSDDTYLCHPATGGYRIWISEEKLEPVAIRSVLFPNAEYVFNEKQTEEYADGGKIAYAPNGAPLFWMPEPEKPVSIEEQLGLPKGVSIHDLPTSEWYNPMRLTFKNGSSIEVIPNEDAIRSKEPELVWIDKIALPTATETKEMVERVRREILKFTNAFPKEEKKLKFTFYVKEGTRVDKSCNGTIPTMTTNIELSDGNVFDEITTIKGSATCDKADYDERQGVLEALANAVCGGEFEKRYKKAVKANKDADLWMRTCYYCGKVFDTVEEKVAHDDWHVERKKARHERYLLRKRAKEIAFEEQAQKMAKEMMG